MATLGATNTTTNYIPTGGTTGQVLKKASNTDHDMAWEDNGMIFLETRELSVDPAAGVEVSFTVPAGEHWKLVTMRVPLVASSTVASREVNIVVSNSSSVILAKWPSTVNQTASQTRNYTASRAARGVSVQSPAENLIEIGEAWLRPTDKLETLTTNLQSGDDYGVSKAIVEVWQE